MTYLDNKIQEALAKILDLGLEYDPELDEILRDLVTEVVSEIIPEPIREDDDWAHGNSAAIGCISINAKELGIPLK